ncbi:MAG: DUF1934 domain-containing protein [Ruminococcus sp.]|nr:DUF1934 domain-containing protein [Ruminococcus sp.]
MKNNVLISLTSIQWQGKEKSETELLTKASYDSDGRYSVISYEDTSATGFEGSVTTIKVDKNKNASIVRKGTANSALTLEMGKKHFCQYGTPYGNMQIGVFTHSIENRLEKEGVLYLKYTLDLNSSYLSDNEIILKIENNDIKN